VEPSERVVEAPRWRSQTPRSEPKGRDFAETGAAISGNMGRLLDVYSGGMSGSAIYRLPGTAYARMSELHGPDRIAPAFLLTPGVSCSCFGLGPGTDAGSRNRMRSDSAGKEIL
jgi:hypothetical protein